MTAYLDNVSRGTVVYARNFNNKYGVSTVARYDGFVDRVKEDEKGVEHVVRDYYLWDLRLNKELLNPVACWRTLAEYAALRSAGKIKMFGDYDEKKDDYVGPKDKEKEPKKKNAA